MKKIFTVLAFLAFTYSGFAQNDRAETSDRSRSNRSDYQNRISPRFLEQLSLTNAQKDQIKTFNEDYRQKMQTLIQGDATAEQRKVKRTEYEIERKNKIMGVLNADQLQKLKTLQSDMKIKTEDGEYKRKVKTEDGKTKIKVKND